MNTLHFKYAVEVEKTGSISQAAKNLFMAQPNLSKAIKELEDTLAIPIFERTSKGVIPTAQGKEFLGYAKKILLQLDKMESLYVPEVNRAARQELKLSIPRGSYISVGFANFVAELNMTKAIELTIQETNSLQTILNVADNGFHLGIIRYQTLYENYFLDYLQKNELASELIWQFSCLVLLPRQHSQASCAEIDFQTLQSSSIEIVHGDNVVPYLPTPEIKQLAVEAADSNAKRVYVYERGSQMELLARIPQTFMWVSPLPQDLLDRFGLVQRSCQISNNSFKDVLIYRRGYQRSATEQLFLDKLYEVKQEVAGKEFH